MNPIAFRIHDFCSIKDSTVCSLSADNITVLAGQNEAGKTAILRALRDFDLNEGHPPLTPEYLPEGRFDVSPRVSLKFSITSDEFSKILEQYHDPEDPKTIPPEVESALRERGYIWIEKELIPGQFHLEQDLKDLWIENQKQAQTLLDSQRATRRVRRSATARGATLFRSGSGS